MSTKCQQAYAINAQVERYQMLCSNNVFSQVVAIHFLNKSINHFLVVLVSCVKNVQSVWSQIQLELNVKML